jgi:SAM-dependent methyltransferase
MATAPNQGMQEHWNGPGGSHWATHVDAYDRLLAAYLDRLLDAAALNRGERVLDIGCGSGASSLAAGEAVGLEGSVVGVDISVPLVELARKRAAEAGLGHVRFEQADAQTAALGRAEFDVVVSRFGVMFFDDPSAAFANIGSAVRTGGRVAFTCWQGVFSNPWMMVPAMAMMSVVPLPLPEPGAPGPFAFADPDHVRDVLAAGGFVDAELTPLELPVMLGGAVDEAVELFLGTSLGTALARTATAEQVEEALAKVREAVAPYETSEGVLLGSAGWLVTASRGA